MGNINCFGGKEVKEAIQLKCEICGEKTGYVNYQIYIDGYAHPLCAMEMEEHERGSKEK